MADDETPPNLQHKITIFHHGIYMHLINLWAFSDGYKFRDCSGSELYYIAPFLS